jgi:hypothetical protein
MQIETGPGLPPEEVTLIYENYKEPLTPVEGGFGYMGTLAQNEAKTHVQCHICGNLFEALGGHIYTSHNMTGEEYKDTFGMALNNALVADAVREKLIEGHRSHFHKDYISEDGRPDWLVKYWDEVKSGKRERPTYKRTAWALERRNREGICPDQVLERIREFVTATGSASQDDFRRYYKEHYMGPIRYFFGGWENAIRLAGHQTVSEQLQEKYAPEKLLDYLKVFYAEHGRSPQRSDWKRGLLPPEYQYRKHWPTLNDARLAANIPAVVPVATGYNVQLSAKQFELYEHYRESLSRSTFQRRRILQRIAEGEIT